MLLDPDLPEDESKQRNRGRPRVMEETSGHAPLLCSGTARHNERLAVQVRPRVGGYLPQNHRPVSES